MKAIILCCDKYHIFAYHTILTYENNIPDVNFHYLVPFNNIIPDYFKKLREKLNKRISFIKCGIKFKETVKKLLEGIDDEQFVYWCSSDTYIEKVKSSRFKKILGWVEDGMNWDVISLFRNKKIHRYRLRMERWEREGMKFLICPSWKNNDFNIWQHQFMKCKILRAIWNNLEEPKKAKELDYQLMDKTHKIYKDKVFVNCKNIYMEDYCLLLGENTTRGKITQNAIESMKKMGIDIPEMEVGKRIIWA